MEYLIQEIFPYAQDLSYSMSRMWAFLEFRVTHGFQYLIL